MRIATSLPRRLFALFGLCASLCQASAASAEDKPAPRKADKPQAAAPSAADVKRADVLFKQAITFKKQGKSAEACPLFEQSQALDPNGATLVHLAECHETEGKTGTAWRELQEAYKLAKETENQEIITWTRGQIHAIVPKLFQLTVLIPPETRDTPGITVHLDGEPLNVQVPSQFRVVDPGKHTITASAPARPDFRQEVVFAPTLRKRTVVVTLEVPPPPPLDYRPSIALLSAGTPTLVTGGLLVGLSLASKPEEGFRDAGMAGRRGPGADRGRAGHVHSGRRPPGQALRPEPAGGHPPAPACPGGRVPLCFAHDRWSRPDRLVLKLIPSPSRPHDTASPRRHSPEITLASATTLTTQLAASSWSSCKSTSPSAFTRTRR